MNNLVISDAIKYVGCDDLDLDIFESQYVLEEGMAYNSYVILDEKVAVLDTIDARCTEEWFANLAKVLGERTPDYLVVHHMEPDHAANIASFCAKYPSAVVVCSAGAAKMIPQFYEGGIANEIQVIKEGDVLELGEHSLTFYSAPMVHWPEVMVSHEAAEKILFSADGFGKFGAICHEEPYDPEVDNWSCEARRYYFNIVGKYGRQVQALLKKAATLDIQMICPLHGPILRENLGFFIDRYNTWSSYTPEEPGVFVAFASIHGNTAHVAQEFAEILEAKGAPKVVVCDLAREDQAEAVEDAFRYSHLVLCAASYDAGVFPPMDHFLCHLRDKMYQNRTIGLIENGSFAPSALRTMKGFVEKMPNVTVCENAVTIWSTLKEADKEKLEVLAEELLSK